MPCRFFFSPIYLRQLLLDEEGAQMRQLPGAGAAENDELDNHPSNDTGVGGLGLISELGLAFLFAQMSVNLFPHILPKKKKKKTAATYTLEDLFAANVV